MLNFFKYLHWYFQYGGWKMDTQLKKMLENPLESPDKVSLGTVEKLTLEDMDIQPLEFHF